jgi:hypothetical protein
MTLSVLSNLVKVYSSLLRPTDEDVKVLKPSVMIRQMFAIVQAQVVVTRESRTNVENYITLELRLIFG